MSPLQLSAIHRSAITAAVAHRSGWPVINPHPAQSEEAKEWQAAFEAELKVAA